MPPTFEADKFFNEDDFDIQSQIQAALADLSFTAPEVISANPSTNKQDRFVDSVLENLNISNPGQSSNNEENNEFADELGKHLDSLLLNHRHHKNKSGYDREALKDLKKLKAQLELVHRDQQVQQTKLQNYEKILVDNKLIPSSAGKPVDKFTELLLRVGGLEVSA